MDPDAQALTVDPASFQFVAAGPGAGSAVLKTALARYRQIVFPDHAAAAAEGGLANRGGAAAVAATLRVLGSLTVAVGSASEELELHTSENYSLTIAAANGPYGNFDVNIEFLSPSPAHFSAPSHHTQACPHAMQHTPLRAHSHRTLIGACNPMLFTSSGAAGACRRGGWRR